MKQPSIRDVPSPFRVSSYEDACELRLRVENCYPVLTEGAPHYLQYDPLFWDFYKVNKDALRAAKVFVAKEDTHWVLKASPLLDPGAEKQQKLDEALSRWREKFQDCCVPFSDLQIVKYEKRGHESYYYMLRCPMCLRHVRSEQLPFIIVRYLVEQGLEPKIIEKDRCSFCGWVDAESSFVFVAGRGDPVCKVAVYKFFNVDYSRDTLYDSGTGEALDTLEGTGRKDCEVPPGVRCLTYEPTGKWFFGYGKPCNKRYEDTLY